MHKQTHVYNLSTTTNAFYGLSLQSEAIAPIITEKQDHCRGIYLPPIITGEEIRFTRYSHFFIFRKNPKWPPKVAKIANLISKLNFYKLIPYPMDNSLSGRRRPARQTSEKDVLCFHRPGRSSAVHSPGGV